MTDSAEELFPDAPPCFALNERQYSVAQTLVSVSKNDNFGEWYQGALQALASNHPDCFSQAANSIREITEKIAEHLGTGIYEPPTSKAVALTRKIITIREQSPEDHDSLLKAVDELINIKSILDAPRRGERFSLGLSNSNKSQNSQSPKIQKQRDTDFRKLHHFFENVTHHRHHPTSEEFGSLLHIFESLVINYLSPVTTEQQKQIKEILQSDPSETLFLEIDNLIKHSPANEAYLLRILRSSEWVEYLKSRDFLTALPEPEETSDGGSIHKHSPVLATLTQIAPKNPELIINILKQLPDTKNFQVREQLVRCHAALTSKSTIEQSLKLLKPLVRKYHTHFTSPNLLKSWMNIEAYKETLEISGAYLSQIIDSEDPSAQNLVEWEIQQVDKVAIQPLIGYLPKETAFKLFRLLNYLLENKHPNLQADEEKSTCFTPYVEELDQPPSREGSLDEILSLRLYQAANSIKEKDSAESFQELTELLKKHPWGIFNRIRHQLYANFPELTLKEAREEVLDQIPNLHTIEASHRPEFEAMLRAHIRVHPEKFLTPDEITQFFDNVLSGPIFNNGEFDDDERYVRKFRIEQLRPIKKQFSPEQQKIYDRLIAENGGVEPESHTPRLSGGRSGIVEMVAPKNADEMFQKGNEELWEYLNTCEMTSRYMRSDEDWLKEESLDALGKKFAQFVKENLIRFPTLSHWWTNIKRPDILRAILEEKNTEIIQGKEAPNQYDDAEEEDWEMLLGISQHILAEGATYAEVHATSPPEDEESFNDPWGYARQCISRFLENALKPKTRLPDSILPQIKDLLLKNLTTNDFGLSRRNSPQGRDWQSTAINSVHGCTLEAMLHYAWHEKIAEKSEDDYLWVFEAISECLSRPDESPATYAILGSRLRLLIYLFGDKVATLKDDLFTETRLVQKEAFLVSHTIFDRPMPKVLTTLPEIIPSSLELLEKITQEDTSYSNHSRFSSRLGVNISFYLYNDLFEDEASAFSYLSDFFTLAPLNERKNCIQEIASIFRKADYSEESQPIYENVVKLGEWRVEEIKNSESRKTIPADETDQELSAFIDWLGCQCFNAKWRVSFVSKVLSLISSPIDSYRVADDLCVIGENQENLAEALSLLTQILKNFGDSNLWQFESDDTVQLVKSGLESEVPETVTVAQTAQDALLRQELFIFLDN